MAGGSIHDAVCVRNSLLLERGCNDKAVDTYAFFVHQRDTKTCAPRITR